MLWGHHLSVCIFTLVISGPSQFVELIGVDIPEQEEVNRDVSLKCLFELHLSALLYSVKWYKDGSEFYRYLPGEIPPAQAFPLPGISVNVSSSVLNFFNFIFNCFLQGLQKRQCLANYNSEQILEVMKNEFLWLVLGPCLGYDII